MLTHAIEGTWKFARRHLRELAVGCIFGCVIGFVFPTLLHLCLRLTARYGYALWLSNKHLEKFVKWPQRGTATIAVLAALVILFYGVRLNGFLRKIVRSWSAGLVSGTTAVWVVTSAIAFGLTDWTGSLLYLLLLGAGILGTFLIASRDLRITEKTSGLSDIDPDKPIEASNEDILGRAAVVNTIVRAIVSDRIPVLAITGTYGDGKTSVLNLVSERLEKRSDVLVVPFSTWLPMDVETLVSSLLGSIIEKLETRFSIPRIRKNVLAFARVLFAVLPHVPSSFKELIQKPSQSDQTKELKQSLSKLPIRIAVLLDDIDRLQRQELEVLFKLLRGVHELPQITFVCAFHLHALVQILRKDSTEEAQRFLEKFFPDEIPLPRIEEAKIAVAFEERFYALCDLNNLILAPEEREQFKQELRTVWQKYLKAYFNNLRRLKIIINRLNRSLPIVGNEVNLRDFVLLEIVRMMNPLLYEEIFRNGRYFIFGQWRVTTWLDIIDVEDVAAQRRRNVFFGTLFEELPKPSEIMLGVLSEIFPTVNAYLSSSHDAIPAPQSPDEAQRQRRVYHPDFFARYFIYQVPQDLFGEQELSDFIEKMNSQRGLIECVAIFEARYDGLKQLSMKRWDFLRRVGFSIDRFSEVPLQSLPIALANLSDSLESDPARAFDELAAQRIVFGAADRLNSSLGAQALLENLIRIARSDRFATNILNASGDKNTDFRSRSSVKKEKLEDVFRERMHGKYGPNGISSFFPSDGRSDIVPLGRWALCGPEGKAQVRQYLREEFDRRHSNLGKFLTYVFPSNIDMDIPSAYTDPLKAIDIYFSVEELNTLLNEHGTTAYASPDESRATEEFKSRYKTASSAND